MSMGATPCPPLVSSALELTGPAFHSLTPLRSAPSLKEQEEGSPGSCAEAGCFSSEERPERAGEESQGGSCEWREAEEDKEN